jgi:hypothetical protein
MDSGYTNVMCHIKKKQKKTTNMNDAKKERANKDMLYGALWCIGGIVATVADFGYIFWGAIIFGAIQFLKGAFNYLTQVKKEPSEECEKNIYYCKYCDYEQETDFEFCPKCFKNDDGIAI